MKKKKKTNPLTIYLHWKGIGNAWSCLATAEGHSLQLMAGNWIALMYK